MGVIIMGDIAVHGNFEEVQLEKPEDFDYKSDAKWLEPYSMEWRETMGNAICSCTKVEVHFQPYYGFDYYHQKTCSLMRKLDAEPQITNLREVYLPQMNQWDDSVKNDGKSHIWVNNKSKRPKKIAINVIKKDKRQSSLLLMGGI